MSILEGSIQPEGSRIRVRAQLIHVDDDAHLWSDVYQREVTSVFDIQDEISHSIVVINPCGGFSGAGHICPHNDLHHDDLEFLPNGHIWIRIIHHMCGHNVFNLLKPPSTELAQDLPLKWNSAPTDIERRLAICGNQNSLSGLPIDVSNFALITLSKVREIGLF